MKTIDREEILALITLYAEKHPLAVEIGSEYIMQDDEAQVDALELVCNIFDCMQEAEQFGTDINVGSN